MITDGCRTADLGGSLKTTQMADEIIAACLTVVGMHEALMQDASFVKRALAMKRLLCKLPFKVNAARIPKPPH